jgi:uncharacterized protein (DUF983 family)
MIRIFPTQTCPHCGNEIRLNELPHQGLFKSFRICPNCGRKFTVDTDSKYRQAIFIVVLLISLVFSILLYLRWLEWLIPSIVSYFILGVLFYWGNRKLFLVPSEKDKNPNNDS